MADTSVSYTCPSCSAPLSFTPGKSKIVCEYCDCEFEVSVLDQLYEKKQEQAADAAAAKEAQWKTDEAGSEWSEEEAAMLKAYCCSSCGAEIVCDENTMATECCYCGNPTMLPSRFTGMLKPDYVIPFELTKKDAVEALKKFYEGKRLLPDNFTANNRIEDIQAMYVPFWLFNSAVTGHGLYDCTDVDVYSTRDERITTTRHYKCSRSGSMSFTNIPVDGSVKMDDAYMETIEPFDYSKMVPFSTAYLSGFLADKYDVDAEAAVERADKRVTSSVEGCLAQTIAHDTVSADSVSIVKDEGDVSYALVPVWILSTKYEDKPYTFMMNGQTGRFAGSLPIDYGKLRNYTIMSFIPLAIIGYFVAKLFDL